MAISLVFDVSQQPFVGVEAVVVLLQNGDRIVDTRAILQSLANARGQRLPLDVEPRLTDGRFRNDQADIVQVIVHAALDPAWIGLHQNTVPLGRLDVEPDIEMSRSIKTEHRDMAEYDFAVLGGRAVAAKALQCIGLGAGMDFGCWRGKLGLRAPSARLRERNRASRLRPRR